MPYEHTNVQRNTKQCRLIVQMYQHTENIRESRTMSCERASVQRNVKKARRLINRRTYLRTEKRCEDVM